MSWRNPSLFWRKVIVGSVYGGLGMLVGMLLGLIPERIVVLMTAGGLFGAWVGSRTESESKSPEANVHNGVSSQPRHDR
jgi:uncharacterized membrane protein YfcA